MAAPDGLTKASDLAASRKAEALAAELGEHTDTAALLIAAIAGGVGSVSSNTSYIESAAGVGEGARTGIASLVTGVG